MRRTTRPGDRRRRRCRGCPPDGGADVRRRSPPQPAIPAQRLRPQEPKPVAPRTVTLADPRVEQPSVRRYYLVPSATTAAAGESPALDVLAQLMGGGSNSYLYRALVVDQPLAVSASAGYQGTSLDATQFTISASPKPGVEFAQIEQVIDEVIADIATERGSRRGSRARQDPADRRGASTPRTTRRRWRAGMAARSPPA